MPNSRRLQLQAVLEGVLGSGNVYFQPPEDHKMQYPCIRYSISNERPSYADNQKYRHMTGYTIMVIDYNPDSIIPSLIGELPYCAFDRHYPADSLNHFVYTLYY